MNALIFLDLTFVQKILLTTATDLLLGCSRADLQGSFHGATFTFGEARIGIANARKLGKWSETLEQ